MFLTQCFFLLLLGYGTKIPKILETQYCQLYLLMLGYGTKTIPKILEILEAIPKILEIRLSIPKILEIWLSIPKIL